MLTDHSVINFPTSLDIVQPHGTSYFDLALRLSSVAALMDHARDLILENVHPDGTNCRIGSQLVVDLVPAVLHGALALLRTVEPAIADLASDDAPTAAPESASQASQQVRG